MELNNLLPKVTHTISIFLIRCLRLGSRGVHRTQVWVALNKSLGTAVQKALTNPCFRKQDATLTDYLLGYEKIFVPKKFCH